MGPAPPDAMGKEAPLPKPPLVAATEGAPEMSGRPVTCSPSCPAPGVEVLRRHSSTQASETTAATSWTPVCSVETLVDSRARPAAQHPSVSSGKSDVLVRSVKSGDSAEAGTKMAFEDKEPRVEMVLPEPFVILERHLAEMLRGMEQRLSVQLQTVVATTGVCNLGGSIVPQSTKTVMRPESSTEAPVPSSAPLLLPATPDNFSLVPTPAHLSEHDDSNHSPTATLLHAPQVSLADSASEDPDVAYPFAPASPTLSQTRSNVPAMLSPADSPVHSRPQLINHAEATPLPAFAPELDVAHVGNDAGLISDRNEPPGVGKGYLHLRADFEVMAVGLQRKLSRQHLHDIRMLTDRSDPYYASESSDNGGLDEKGFQNKSSDEPKWSPPGTIVLKPDSPLRTILDACTFLVLLYDCMLQPYRLTWSIPAAYAGAHNIVYHFTLAFWTVHMLLNFICGYYTRGEGDMEIRLSKVARRYFRGWFLIDFTINAVDWMGVALGSTDDIGFVLSVRTAGHLGRVIRTARVAGVWSRLVSGSSDLLSEKVAMLMNVLQLVAIIVWINHLFTCVWGKAGHMQSDMDQSWLDRQDGGPLGASYREATAAYQYLTALHFSLTQMTPGSMEVFPTNSLERFVNVLLLVCGLLLNACFISQLSAKMVQYNMSRQQELARMRDVRRFLRENGVDPHLASRIMKQIWSRLTTPTRLMEQNVQGLNLLSNTLRLELQREVFAPHLRCHPLFYVWQQISPVAVAELCRLDALHFKCLSPGDDLFVPAAAANEAHLVLQGVLQYTLEVGDRQVTRIEPGTWLTEAALWIDWTYRGTMEALTKMEAVSLNAPLLVTMIKKRPELLYITWDWAKTFREVESTDEENTINSPKRSSISFSPKGNEKLLEYRTSQKSFGVAGQPQSQSQLDVSADHGAILVSLPEASRNLLEKMMMGLVNNQVGWRRRKGAQELQEEVSDGACLVLIEGDGKVVRTVFVAALCITRTEDLRILVQIAKISHSVQEDLWIASVEMPGTKVKIGDNSRDVARRLLEVELKPFAGRVKLGHRSERKTDLKESASYGMPTRYHKTIFTARLGIGEDDETLPDSGNAGRSNNTRSSSVASVGSVMNSVSQKMNMGSRISSNSIESKTFTPGETMEIQEKMYAWLEPSEFEILKRDDRPVRQWLASYKPPKRKASISFPSSSFPSSSFPSSLAAMASHEDSARREPRPLAATPPGYIIDSADASPRS